jgi:hypothetical protein
MSTTSFAKEDQSTGLSDSPAESSHDLEKTGRAASSVGPVVAQESSSMVDLVARKTDFGFLPIPPSCQYNPDQPPIFYYWKTAIFALASTFSTFSHKLDIPTFYFLHSPFSRR